MKKRFYPLTILLLAAAAALLLSGCGFFGSEPGISGVIHTLAPTEQASTPSPTDAPTPTAEPTATPEPTDTPAPTPNDGLLALVNFNHPMSSEPPVVALSRYLTAANVTCDVRRHGNAEAAEALNDMLLAAEDEGDFHFIIASAFRSIYEQEVLWAPRHAEDPDYGSDPYASPVCVMPPYCSEHITGLAFDILCDSCPHSDELFARSAEGLWLAQNAHRFGFILRFPEDKQHITGVQYEPWHFRYVGLDAAQYIYEHGLCLEEYLGAVPRS